jgi:phosphate transport system substrate-binding protein
MRLQCAMQADLRRRTAMASIAATTLSLAIGSSHRASAAEQAILRIGGTGMALATARQISEAFMAMRSTVLVDVLPSLGTSGGLAAVAAGAIDIAVSVRTINDAEKAKGLRSLAYARTPIAFVTHASSAVRGVTLSEVAMILSGARTSWPDGTVIRLVRRDASDADWTLLRSLSAELAQAVATAQARPGLVTVATDQENADVLERLPGSFGIMSIGQMRAEARHVIALSLDGEAPEVEAVAAGRYRLSRTLHAAWRDPPGADVAGFLHFLCSEPGSAILLRLGHIALAGTGS